MFGMMLFMLKGVRALNDNIAPIVYNATLYLPAYFWIGLVACLGSLASCTTLMNIHTSVI